MKVLGPLKYYSSMRYERYHKKLKKISKATNSRVNPAHTLGIKNQQQLCQSFNDNCQFSSGLSCNISNQQNVCSVDEYSNFAYILPLILSNCIVTKSLKIYGTNYETNMILKIDGGDDDDESHAKFGRIRYICLNNEYSIDKIAFLYTSMENVNFSYQIQGLEVDDSIEWGIIFHDVLDNYKPLEIHIIENKKYIVML